MTSRNLQTLLLFLVVLFAVTFFWFFLKDDTPPKTPSDPASPLLQQYTLLLGHDHTKSSPHHQAAVKFAELVKERSAGLIQVEIHPNQQLGTGHQMVEQAREGTLPIALVPAARLTGIAPAMQYIDLPFLFPTREDAYEMLGGEIGSRLLAQLEPHGLIGCAFWDSGFKQFTANSPITGPDDFQGLKVRIMKSPIIRDQYQSFGASTLPVDFHQLYDALRDGVVDAQENPLIGIAEMKLYEVQKFLTLSNHSYLVYVFLCSKKVMDELPEDLRYIIIDAAKEAALYEREILRSREEGYLEKIQSAGVTIHTLSEEERLAFRQATSALREKYRNKIGRDLISRTEELLTLKYGPGDDLVIGLDADLSLGTADFGQAIKRGMELAVAELNSSGGILGRKIRIVSLDHEGVSARGINNIERFAAVPNLVAVVGGLHSAVSLAELETIHANEMIFLGPYANATPLVENGYQPNYVFRVSPPDKYMGQVLVEQALQKSNKVALVLENTDWGRNNQKTMVKTLAKRGFAPTAVEWLNYGEQDIGPQLTRIFDSGAEVLISAVSSDSTKFLFKSLAPMNRTMPVISHWGIGTYSSWQKMKPELEQIDVQFVQTFSFSTPRTEKAKRLAKMYLQEYGLDSLDYAPAPSATAQAYDLVHLLAAAIKNGGSIERPAIRAQLEKIDHFAGAMKSYNPPFTESRHDALDKNDIFMARFNDKGAIVPVTTK